MSKMFLHKRIKLPNYYFNFKVAFCTTARKHIAYVTLNKILIIVAILQNATKEYSSESLYVHQCMCFCVCKCVCMCVCFARKLKKELI